MSLMRPISYAYFCLFCASNNVQQRFNSCAAACAFVHTVLSYACAECILEISLCNQHINEVVYMSLMSPISYAYFCQFCASNNVYITCIDALATYIYGGQYNDGGI